MSTEEWKDKLRARIEARSIPEPNTGCWIWLGGLRSSGYACFHRDNVSTAAHRASWESIHGKAPEGAQACHRCDNRWCVNPDHIFLGTIADNMADKTRKGRQAKGEQHGYSKLTNAQARDIKAALAAGERGASIARRFSVSSSTVSLIKRGKIWLHITEASC